MTPLPPSVPPPLPRSSQVEIEMDLELTPDSLTRVPGSAPGSVPDRQMPDLGVSNEALLASLRPLPPETPFTWLRRSLRPVWNPVEQRLLGAVYWLCDRPPLQGVVLSAGGGAVIGLGLIIAYASSLRADAELASGASANPDAPMTAQSASARRR